MFVITEPAGIATLKVCAGCAGSLSSATHITLCRTGASQQSNCVFGREGGGGREGGREGEALFFFITNENRKQNVKVAGYSSLLVL